MPLIADHTITVTNRYYDGALDRDTALETDISGVSFYNSSVQSVQGDGLKSADVYRIRIFANSSILTATRRDGGPDQEAVGLPAEDTYVPAKTWAEMGDEDKAKHWTLKAGDRISCDGVDVTILSVRDNRGHRVNPHWYVEGK